MRLDEKLDSGPIITLQKIVIEDDVIRKCVQKDCFLWQKNT